MRIAIVTTQCPFIVGGAELHAKNLEQALRNAGHEAEIVSMPFKWYPPQTVLDHMLAARCLDISEFMGTKIDLAIGLKFPAYLMQHPNKVFWILHQHRQAYDLWDSGLSDLLPFDNGRVVRSAILEADNVELGRARRVFANSANVAKRLLHYNQIASEPLYHPPPLAGRLHGGAFGDYFYYPSRLTGFKRQDFVLRALAETREPCKVIFSGAPDSPDYGEQLKQLARELGIEQRVTWRGFVSEAEMIELYANARGVLFTPIDEDLGYIALEAMLAGKPLVTLTDAGEPAHLVRDGIEGLVTAPEISAFAAALDRLTRDEGLARHLGAAGSKRYRDLDISWESAVAKLTEPPAVAEAIEPEAIQVAAQEQPITVSIGGSDWRTKRRRDGRESAFSQPFEEDIEALAAEYDFGEALEAARPQLALDWRRLQATLEFLALADLRPARILDVGTASPHVFAALLRRLYPDAQLFGIQEGPAGHQWEERVASRTRSPHGDIAIKLAGLNVETSAFPFPDESFDLVLGMEILEHLSIDPSHMFREVARVTRSEGGFLITTPNLVSWPAIGRALRGVSPYSSGQFAPWNGTYGRHNREYTPAEVEALGRHAGFDTELLETEDVCIQEKLPHAVLQGLSENRYSFELRGQNIFYFGRKPARPQPAPFPDALFARDPALFDGALELLRGATPAEHILRITNKSPLVWRAEGPGRICLTADKVEQNGFVRKSFQSFDLPCDIAPGDRAEVTLTTTTGIDAPHSWFEIGLFAAGLGAFAPAGRTGTISIFARSLSASTGARC